MLTCSCFNCWLVGDIHFEAQRRFWSQTTAAPSFTYIFTDSQPSADPAPGVFHGSELAHLFGNFKAIEAGHRKMQGCRAMLDFWISFAVSLTPNDGRGTRSAFCYVSIFFFHPDPAFRTSMGNVWETEVRINSRKTAILVNLL